MRTLHNTAGKVKLKPIHRKIRLRRELCSIHSRYLINHVCMSDFKGKRVKASLLSNTQDTARQPILLCGSLDARYCVYGALKKRSALHFAD